MIFSSEHLEIEVGDDTACADVDDRKPHDLPEGCGGSSTAKALVWRVLIKVQTGERSIRCLNIGYIHVHTEYTQVGQSSLRKLAEI